MKKINSIFLKSKKYFVFHQPHFLFLLIAGAAIYFLSILPYFNIIFFPEGSIVLFIILSVYVLRLNEKIVFYFALFLLILIPLFLMVKNIQQAEKIGDIAFFILIVGFIQNFRKYLKEIKPENEKS